MRKNMNRDEMMEKRIEKMADSLTLEYCGLLYQFSLSDDEDEDEEYALSDDMFYAFKENELRKLGIYKLYEEGAFMKKLGKPSCSLRDYLVNVLGKQHISKFVLKDRVMDYIRNSTFMIIDAAEGYISTDNESLKDYIADITSNIMCDIADSVGCLEIAA